MEYRSPSKEHLPRTEVVDKIYDAAKSHQHVVIGSSAATGKTSLLQLLKKKLKEDHGDEVNVIRICMSSDESSEYYKELLVTKGIPKEIEELEKSTKKTWLLLDDAQNAYAEKFNSFWQFVVKTLSTAEIQDDIFVVIAAAYDLSTSESPVDFFNLLHIEPNATEEEINGLLRIHMEVLKCPDWERYCQALMELSKLSGNSESDKESRYHIGVVMAGVRVIAEEFNRAGRPGCSEDQALDLLRRDRFTRQLNRCFRLPNELPKQFKTRLLDAVMGELEAGQINSVTSLVPFVRAGLLTSSGAFSTMAARWYYNRNCFPGRAEKKPTNLNELVKSAVGSMSAS